jgi:two-component sensor histidine kinase
MTDSHSADPPEKLEAVLEAPGLADALESERFRHFLDQIPIAIVVAEIGAPKNNSAEIGAPKQGVEIGNHETITYANPEFEKLFAQSAAELQGKPWTTLHGKSANAPEGQDDIGIAIITQTDRVGTFTIHHETDAKVAVDVYSNIIEDENGTPAFRLAAMVDLGASDEERQTELTQRIAEKDTLLREIQHRVKNNLQMITALLRIEARNAAGRIDTAAFDRLAGRIEAIGLVYRLLSDEGAGDVIDLGVYLSSIASGVMQAHATEGIRLDLQVDTYPVSVNVAMPAGMLVNELLTNALKHAFPNRERGTITLHSLTDKTGCHVIVADDGVGMPPGVEWPKRGKLGALIVRSLRENAGADLTVESSPKDGTRVTIVFTRQASAPEHK